MTSDEPYMWRCLDLAKNGLGTVSPNPMVGSVIVHDQVIVGEGWHREFGGPHAEVNAIGSISSPDLLNRSTLYVNLEPCSHWGKTPPCISLILEKKIPRVVIGALDPFEERAGKGVQILRDAGVEVVTGVLEKESLELNRRFFTFHARQRPYVILKWAQTLDGFIAREDYSSKWISGPYARLLVHHWRGQEDAIMVGTNTAVYDNPLLTSRDMAGKNPLRVVLDRHLRIPQTHHLVCGEEPTLIFTAKEKKAQGGCEYFTLDFDSDDLIRQVLSELHRRGIQSLLIEGGANLLLTFLTKGLWDEARIFRSQTVFGSGISAPPVSGHLFDKVQVENDELLVMRREI